MERLVKWLQMSKKAIYGGLITAVAWFIAEQGFTLDTTIREVANALPAGVINGVVIWWTTNQVGSVARKR